jgi:hypothetical protein
MRRHLYQCRLRLRFAARGIEPSAITNATCAQASESVIKSL